MPALPVPPALDLAKGRGSRAVARAKEATEPPHGEKGLGERKGPRGALPVRQHLPACQRLPSGFGAAKSPPAVVQEPPGLGPQHSELRHGQAAATTPPAELAPRPTSTGLFMQEGGSSTAGEPGRQGCWCWHWR